MSLERLDTTHHIFNELSISELISARLACSTWRDQIDGYPPLWKNRLQTDFHIPERIASELQSPGLIYRRLARIVKRGKSPHLPDSKLYRMYCASGNINEDFLHLLDSDEKWFEQYFANRDTFFLAYHLCHACAIGSASLIIYLNKRKLRTLTSVHLNLALASDDIPSIYYVINKKGCAPKKNHRDVMNKHAVYSGRMEVLEFLANRYSKKLSDYVDFEFCVRHFIHAVEAGNVEAVKFMRVSCRFPVNRVSVEDVEKSKSLNLLKYLLEECDWVPHERSGSVKPLFNGVIKSKLFQAAYRMGRIDIVEYLEAKYSRLLPFWHKELFFAAAIPGDLTCLRHAQSLEPTAPLTAQSFEAANRPHLLKGVCESGNLESLKFLLNECEFTATVQLLEYAATSGNPTMVFFLMETFGYPLSREVSVAACKSENLDAIFTLYPADQALTPNEIHELITSIPRCMHYLITKKNHPVNYKMLSNIFAEYCHTSHLSSPEERDERDDDLFHFAQYLIEVHHLSPSVIMRGLAEAMARRGAPGISELIAIFPPVQDAAEQDAQNRPRIGH